MPTTLSPLVVTEHGVGFWDSVRRELRLAFSVHVSPRPRQMREATATEATLFYALRHATRSRLCAYYNGPGYKGD